MKTEQLERANQIVKTIEALVKHREQIKEKGMELGWYSQYGFTLPTLTELMPISHENFEKIYNMNIDGLIAKLEKEFENL